MYEPILHALRGNAYDEAIAGITELAHPLPASFGPARFAAGHWRQYADALAEPFAMLRPVSMRLGYLES